MVAGQMRFRLGRFGRRTILARPGDTVRVPAGTAHWFGNAGAGVAHARVEARPLELLDGDRLDSHHRLVLADEADEHRPAGRVVITGGLVTSWSWSA